MFAITPIISCPISTHTLRKEGDSITKPTWDISKISTHTLRKEGDGTCWGSFSMA